MTSLTLTTIPLPDLILAVLKVCGGRIESEHRLNKILYLVDWNFSLTKGRTLSGLEWRCNEYGPFLEELPLISRNMEEIKVQTRTWKEGEYSSFCLRNDDVQIDANLLAEIGAMKKIFQLPFEELKKLADETPPLKTAKIGQSLDLLGLATEHRRGELDDFFRSLGDGDKKAMEYLAQ